jgi:hypothetical protein
VIFAGFTARIAGDDNFIERSYGSFRIFPDTAALRCAMTETPVRSSGVLLAGCPSQWA